LHHRLDLGWTRGFFIAFHPGILENVTAWRQWALVVLGFKIMLAHVLFELRKILFVMPGTLKNVPRTEPHTPPSGNNVVNFFLGMNSRQDQFFPATVRDEVSWQILGVKPLCNNNDLALLRVVKAAVNR
jgi:hypothetical protein